MSAASRVEVGPGLVAAVRACLLTTFFVFRRHVQRRLAGTRPKAYRYVTKQSADEELRQGDGSQFAENSGKPRKLSNLRRAASAIPNMLRGI
jgi:hypothetical protein